MPEIKADISELNAVAGQKRQNTDVDGPVPKKANIPDDSEVLIKVLIPLAAVGALIGKGGETMKNLKNETGCRINMSKEVYQGTHERVCMIRGKISSVVKVIGTILEKTREKIDEKCQSDVFDLKGVDRRHELKLVMPSTSAAMVIGKAGAHIKEIRESTGAHVQVYPRAGSEEAKNTTERVMTIAAEIDSTLREVVQRVLDKVAADPLHASTKLEGPPSAIGLHGMPNRNIPTVYNENFGNSGSNSWTCPFSDNNFNLPNIGYNSVKINPLGLGNNEVMAFLDSLQSTLRNSGFNEASVAEIMQSMQVLAKYNIMGLGLGLGVAAMASMRTHNPNSYMPSSTSGFPVSVNTSPTSVFDNQPNDVLNHMAELKREFNWN